MAALSLQLRRLQVGVADEEVPDVTPEIDFVAELTSAAAVLGALREAQRGQADLRVLCALGTAAQATIARAAADTPSSNSRYRSHARARSRALMTAELKAASLAEGASLSEVRQAFELGGRSAARASGLFGEGQFGGAGDNDPSGEDEDGDGAAGVTAALDDSQPSDEDDDSGDDYDDEAADQAAAAYDASQAAAAAADAAAAAAAYAAAAASGGQHRYPRPSEWGSVEEARRGMSPFSTERSLQLCAVTDFEKQEAIQRSSGTSLPTAPPP